MSFQTARPWLSRLVAAVLFVGALLVLRTELDALSFSGLLDGLAELGPGRIGRAAALTAVAFVALVAADWISAEEARAGLSHLRVVLGAFLGYAFSLSLGSPLFGKAPVHGRLYAAWGMEPETVSRVVGGARLTLATGFLALLGWGLLDLPGLPAPMAGRLLPGDLAESVLRLGHSGMAAPRPRTRGRRPEAERILLYSNRTGNDETGRILKGIALDGTISFGVVGKVRDAVAYDCLSLQRSRLIVYQMPCT